MRFTWMYFTSSVDFVIYKLLYVLQVDIRFFSDDRLWPEKNIADKSILLILVRSFEKKSCNIKMSFFFGQNVCSYMNIQYTEFKELKPPFA